METIPPLQPANHDGAILEPVMPTNDSPGTETVTTIAIAPAVVETSPAMRSAIRTDMAKLAGVFLAAVFFMQVVGIVIVAALISPSFRNALGSHSPSMITAAMKDTLSLHAALINIILVVVAALFYLFIRGRRLFTTDITTTIPVGRRWGLLARTPLIMFGIVGATSVLANLIRAITGHNPAAAESSLVSPMSTSVLGLLFIVLIGPFIEEVVFRGAIMRFLMPYGVNFAIVTQALLFGLYHMNFWQSLFAFALGLVLGYVAARFSLKWSYALHVLNNGVNMLMGTSETTALVIVIATWVCLLGAIVLTIKDRIVNRPLITEGRSTVVAHPFRTAWTQPFFLIVVIILFVVGFVFNMQAMLK